MSLLTQQTSVNQGKYFFLLADVSTLNVNSISTGTVNAGSVVANTVSSVTANVSTITADQVSTIVLEGNDAIFSTLSTVVADVNELNTSTIFTTQLTLDNQTLNATATELLLNGIPIATTSNLSSIADWALDPAISTVNMLGNNLISAGIVYASNVMCSNLFALNAFHLSSYTSTVSSVIEVAEDAFFSTLSSGNASFGSAAASTISCGTITASTVGAEGATLSTLTVGAGGRVGLENFGVSFASVGSAQLGFSWFYQASTSTDFFYDTNISSVRVMTQTPGGYTDSPASRLHVPEAGISSLQCSSINGAEFTPSSITVNVVGVSSLVANSISSVGAEIRQALMSTIVFSPSLNPSLGGVNVNLGLGGILGNVIGWGAGVLGAATGVVALGTSVAGLMMGRQTQYIDNTKYELVNGTTQLQYSTLGTSYSTIYRFNDSTDPERVPGQEVYISTVYGPGLAVRSMSDPIYTLSTPNSTIQSFGQWVHVPIDVSTMVSTFSDLYTSSLVTSTINGVPVGNYLNQSTSDWALYPAQSTIAFSTGVAAILQSSDPNTANIGIVGSNIQLIGGFTQTQTLVTSTISTAYIQGANPNLFNLGISGLEVDANQIFLSTTQTNLTGITNASTVAANLVRGRFAEISSVTTSSLALYQSSIYGLSSLMYISTSQIPGTGTSTTTYLNTDLSLLQNDLYCQQLRVGYANPGGSALAEIIMYAPTVGNTTIGFNVGNFDRTARIQSTVNSGFAGYLLDTQLNPPFFSTVNNTSTAIMALFPSTTTNTIGVSTISIIPVSFQTTSAFSGTNIYPNISTTANIIASTSIYTNAPGSYILAQANTSFSNTTNQYHDIYLNLAIDGVVSPSTFTSLPAGTAHYANGAIAYRQAVSSGTHTVVLYASADSNGVAVGTQTDIWATGNLA